MLLTFHCTLTLQSLVVNIPATNFNFLFLLFSIILTIQAFTYLRSINRLLFVMKEH